MAVLTHRVLLPKFYETERNLALSEYPKMYSELVTRNTLLYKRAQGLSLVSIRVPPKRKTQTSAESLIQNDPILRDLTEHDEVPVQKAQSFGEHLNFEYIC